MTKRARSYYKLQNLYFAPELVSYVFCSLVPSLWTASHIEIQTVFPQQYKLSDTTESYSRFWFFLFLVPSAFNCSSVRWVPIKMIYTSTTSFKKHLKNSQYFPFPVLPMLSALEEHWLQQLKRKFVITFIDSAKTTDSKYQLPQLPSHLFTFFVQVNRYLILKCFLSNVGPKNKLLSATALHYFLHCSLQLIAYFNFNNNLSLKTAFKTFTLITFV